MGVVHQTDAQFFRVTHSCSALSARLGPAALGVCSILLQCWECADMSAQTRYSLECCKAVNQAFTNLQKQGMTIHRYLDSGDAADVCQL